MRGMESLVRFRLGESLVGAKINDIDTEEWLGIIYLNISLDSIYLHFIRIGCQTEAPAYPLILHRDVLDMSLVLGPVINKAQCLPRCCNPNTKCLYCKFI